jgi:hypothetical protein
MPNVKATASWLSGSASSSVILGELPDGEQLVFRRLAEKRR